MPSYQGFTCTLYMGGKTQVWGSPAKPRPASEQETVIDSIESSIITYAAITANRLGIQIVGSGDVTDYVMVDITIDNSKRVSRIIPACKPDLQAIMMNHGRSLQHSGQFDSSEYTNSDGQWCTNKWVFQPIATEHLRMKDAERSYDIITVSIRRLNNVTALEEGGMNHLLQNEWKQEWDKPMITLEAYGNECLSHFVSHEFKNEGKEMWEAVPKNSIKFAKGHNWEFLDDEMNPFVKFVFKYRDADTLKKTRARSHINSKVSPSSYQQVRESSSSPIAPYIKSEPGLNSLRSSPLVHPSTAGETINLEEDAKIAQLMEYKERVNMQIAHQQNLKQAKLRPMRKEELRKRIPELKLQYTERAKEREQRIEMLKVAKDEIKIKLIGLKTEFQEAEDLAKGMEEQSREFGREERRDVKSLSKELEGLEEKFPDTDTVMNGTVEYEGSAIATPQSQTVEAKNGEATLFSSGGADTSFDVPQPVAVMLAEPIPPNGSAPQNNAMAPDEVPDLHGTVSSRTQTGASMLGYVEFARPNVRNLLEDFESETEDEGEEKELC